MGEGGGTPGLPSTAELVRFLSSPATYGLTDEEVRVIETHGAYVFLAGDKAYKMKKPVNFGYFDFTTLDKRETDSRREIDLNRRTAPAIYRRVVPVARDAGGALALQGTGDPVEWLVEMVRFDDAKVLDLAVERDSSVLDATLIDKLAVSIAKLHREAEETPDHGGAAAMAAVVDSNHRQFNELIDRFDADDVRRLRATSLAFVDRQASLLDRRRQARCVRRCHGDLHLGNIVLIDNEPVMFDCIEFNDDIACIDVLYDLAFLIMDLDHRGFLPEANRLLNRYLLDFDDEGMTAAIAGLALLPLFLSCRAAVRAHVTARQSRNAGLDADARDRLTAAARTYIAGALRYLDVKSPRLVAIGGLSGSGKSTLARAIAPDLGNLPGAVVLRSDELRKRRFGVDFLTRLDESAYDPEVNAAVYADQRRLAAAVLKAGHSAVADAVFARADERKAIEAVGAGAFTGFWLDAPRRVLADRIGTRTGDASDSTVAVLDRQLTYDLGPLSWHAINVTAPMADVVAAVKKRLF